jgi:hypothetical protein
MVLATGASEDNLAMPRKFDPDDVLDRPLMANLATVTADGAPRNAPMWFLWQVRSGFSVQRKQAR